MADPHGFSYRCADCGRDHLVPHSCRNRHCPDCQGANAHGWLERQEKNLLPVPYFHVVFTVPHELNPLILQNQRVLHTLLFSYQENINIQWLTPMVLPQNQRVLHTLLFSYQENINIKWLTPRLCPIIRQPKMSIFNG